MKRILLGIGIIVIWFWVFPLNASLPWINIASASILLAMASTGFILIRHLRIPLLELGGTLFIYALLIKLLDQFTQESSMWSTVLPTSLLLGGAALVISGLYTSQTNLRDEYARYQMLVEIERAIVAKSSLAEQINLLLDHTLRYLRADLGLVSLLDPNGAQLNPFVVRGARHPAQVLAAPFKRGQGAMGWIVEHGAPLAIKDVATDGRWQNSSAAASEQIVSYLGVPIRVDEQVIGVLDLGTRTARTFTPQEIEFAATLANRTAIAIRNARLLEETQHDARFLALLNTINQTALAATSFQALTQTLADQLGELFGADGCYITQWDAERQVPIHLAASGFQRHTYPREAGTPGVSMTKSVLEAGHALVAEDVHHSPYLNPAITPHYPTQSMLGLPLIVGEQKMGAALVSFHQTHHFTPAEIARGEQVAAQIALAITRMRLLEETQRRAMQLSTLNEIGRAVSALLSVDETLETIYRQVRRILPLDCFFVCLSDPATERISYPLMYDDGVHCAAESAPMPHGTLLGTVIQTGTAARYNRTADQAANAPRAVRIGNLERASASLLFAPLQVGERIIGAISAQSYTLDAYTQEHLDLLIGVAHQAAIALENARLFEAERAQLLLAQTLQEMGKLLTAEMSLPAVLESILDLLGRVVRYDSVSIQLLTPDGTLELVAGRGFPDFEQARHIAQQLGAHTLTTKFTTPNAIVIPDTAADPRWVVTPGTEYIHSWIGAPLRVKGKLIGVLNVDSKTTHAFSPSIGEQVMAFATQAAIAIENARLFKAEQQRATELDAVRQATLGLTAHLELPAVLNAILESTLHFAQGAHNAHIFFAERGDPEHLSFGAALWQDGRREMIALPRQDGLTRTVARTGQLLVVPNLREHPLFADVDPEWQGGIIGLPLKIGERVVGVMNVAYAQPHTINDNELRILRLLGDQAALAIENARLFQTTMRQTKQLTVLNTAAIHVQQSLKPLDIFQAACDELRHLGAFASALTIEGTMAQHVYTAMSEELLRDYIARFGKFQVPLTLPLSVVNAEWEKLQAGTAIIADLLPRLIPNLPATTRPVFEWLQTQCQAAPLLIAPLTRADATVGLLVVMGAQLDTNDLPAVAVFARQVSAALENARLVSELQSALTMTTRLYDLSAQILNATTIDDTARLVLASIRNGLDTDNASIDLYDDAGRMIYHADVGLAPDFVRHAKPRPGGLGARALASTAPITVTDPNLLHPHLRAEGIQTTIATPLPGEHKNVGVLFVGYRQPHQVTARELELLSLFANQTALALRRVRLLDEAHRRAEQLALINQISAAINQPIALDDVLNNTLRELARAFDLGRRSIALLNPARDHFVICAEHNLAGISAALGAHIPVSNRVAEIILAQKHTLAIEATETDPLRHAIAAFFSPANSAENRARLVVPLLSRGQVIGITALESKTEQPGFASAEIEIAQTIAHQTAAAIDKARLFEETQRRAKESELLYTTAQDLTAQADQTRLLETVVERAAALVDANSGAIYLYDAVHSDLELVIERNFGLPLGLRLQTGEGLAGRVARTCQPIIVDDYRTWEHRIPETQGIDFRSGIGVPLMFGGQLLGVLIVSEIGESKRKYNHADAKLLALFAAQAAAVVHNTRLLEDARRRAEQLAVLNRIASLVNQTLSLDSLLQVVHHEIMTALKADSFSIGLYDAVTGEMDYRIREDRGKRETPTRVLLHEGLTHQVIQAQKPLLKNKDELDARRPSLIAWGTLELPQTWLGVPMRVGSAVVGVIAVGSYHPNAFSPEDERLLSIVADQVAAAIEKVQLFEDAQQRALEQSTLSEIARALNATLDVREAFPSVIASLQMLTGEDYINLALFDEQKQTATFIAPEQPPVEMMPDTEMPLADTCGAEDILAGQPHLTYDLADECELRADQNLFDAGYRSRVNLPLIVGEQVIGMLNLASPQVGAFRVKQLDVLMQIAGAIAIAVVNSRLFEAEQTRRAELGALYELSRDLAKAMDFDTILNHVARCAVENIPATFARIALVEDADLVIRAVYPSTAKYPNLGLGRREPLSVHPFCARILGQAEHFIVQRNDPLVAQGNCEGLFVNLAQTLFILPLRIGDRNIGLLMIGERRHVGREPFTPEKVRLAHNISDQAAGALRRAELFAELEKAYLQSVFALANAVDAKDSDTNVHSQRLASLALAVGQALGLDTHALEDLRYGALLHDIGKIGVPDAILQKPGKLNQEEWARMRQHPIIGAQILEPLPRLNGAAAIVRHHHEWYNGTGYPDQLARDAIPIGARILTIVDAYGAILDKRVYKNAQSHTEAIAELRRCAGTQFDPQLVHVFLGVLAAETPTERAE